MTETPKHAKATNNATRYALAVLRAICRSETPLGAAELARNVAIPVGMANRALVSLEATGFVDRIPHSSKFVAGKMTYQLARALLERYEVRTICVPYLRQIAFSTGGAISLWARVGDYCVRLAMVHGSRQRIRTGAVGEVAPIYKSPAGWAILAQLPEGELAAFEARTGCDCSEKIAEVHQIGFASSMIEQDVIQVGLPVLNDPNQLLLSITVEHGSEDFDQRQAHSKALVAIEELAAALTVKPDLLIDPFGHIPVEDIHFATV